MPELNPSQRAAVAHVGGPLLVLAGAGSGKTRVITHKIAHLIRDRGIAPEHIAAVTFTNKAAREMKGRVNRLLGDVDLKGLRVSTFHALGLNVLRREHEALGYRAGFTIFDTADTLGLVRELLRKDYGGSGDAEEALRWRISRWKNAFVCPHEALQAATDARETTAALLYERYDAALKTYNAVDFDDLIVQPARLFQEHPAVLAAWQEHVRYLLVDEYQDTNACQYHLVRLLVGARGGLTVVGDDDQSIYAWRGAQPENLALLARDFPGLEVIKLEENYRSMGRILRAANTLIANNSHLYEKRLWSRLGPGEPLRVMECRSAEHEAERVVSQLLAHRVRHNNQYRDYAILYRGNHQSRPFERLLREHRIPYHLSGGTSFFERTEIKDLMAYLRLLANPDDDAAFLRAANTPRRGIGPGTMERLTGFAQASGQSLMDACLDEALGSQLGTRASNNLGRFARWLVEVGDRAQRGDARAVVGELVEEIDYEGWLRDQSPDPQSAERRVENVQELIGWIGRLLARGDEGTTLSGALARMALLDALEREDDDTGDAVHLMTLHAAKGLEFDYVYLVGMEEELLPHRNSIEEALEEERRLCYVGITRARRGLTFSFAGQRRRYGETMSCEPSRFLGELSQDDLAWEGGAPSDPQERKAQGRAHLAQLRNLLAEPE